MSQAVNQKSSVTAAAVRVSDDLLMQLVVTRDNDQMLPEDLVRRGKQLRVEVRQAFKKLKDENRLPYVAGNSEDVTPLIAKYIPVGMPLQDAETILRNAKLKIAPQLSHWSRRNLDRKKSHMRAEAVLERRMSGEAFLSVIAHPENCDGAPTRVKEVRSIIGIEAVA